jgi:hypothetical protein
MRNVFVIALSLPALMACMPAFGADPVLAPQQVALVRQTCDDVMGLKEGGEYRALCQDSLSKSLARKLAAEESAREYDACRSEGLHDAALATCMLDRPNRAAAASTQPVSLAFDVNSPENAKNYFDITPSEAWRREQYSCAQLGLVPGSNAFQHCAVGLEAALFDPN